MQVKSEVFSRFASSVDFSSGDRSAGWGLPPLAAGALPERRLSLLGLSSKGSLRLVL